MRKMTDNTAIIMWCVYKVKIYALCGGLYV
jgi:hypothetical protein